MSGADYLRELLFPLRSASVLIAMATFFLLASLAWAAGLFGIWLLLIVFTALIRYLVLVAEARANDLDVAPPGIEYFSLVGNFWTLFPVLPVAAAAMLVAETSKSLGSSAALALALTFAFVLPASVAVLVISHSVIESLNPVAAWRLIKNTWPEYLYAPLTAGLLPLALMTFGQLPAWVMTLIVLYLLTAFFAVIGAITRRENLVHAVDIPEPLEVDAAELDARLERHREKVLNHAYGFVSRGNRAGGLAHIDDWIRQDPDPERAWPWFLEQMLKWESSDHALFFAQRYLDRLLAAGEDLKAVKLMLRGRLLNPEFRPTAQYLDAAIEAAHTCDNDELAQALKRL